MADPRFGLFLSQANKSWRQVLDEFQMAEELGFDHAWLCDHLLDTDGPPDHPIHEAWTLLAALAASTSRIRLGVLVSSNTFRHPAVLLKQAVTVDHVSNGRLILGLGTGWYGDEHRRYGIPLPPPGPRVDRFEEAVQVVRLLMSDATRHLHGPVLPAGRRAARAAARANTGNSVADLRAPSADAGHRRPVRRPMGHVCVGPRHRYGGRGGGHGCPHPPPRRGLRQGGSRPGHDSPVDMGGASAHWRQRTPTSTSIVATGPWASPTSSRCCPTPGAGTCWRPLHGRSSRHSALRRIDVRSEPGRFDATGRRHRRRAPPTERTWEVRCDRQAASQAGSGRRSPCPELPDDQRGKARAARPYLRTCRRQRPVATG